MDGTELRLSTCQRTLRDACGFHGTPGGGLLDREYVDAKERICPDKFFDAIEQSLPHVPVKVHSTQPPPHAVALAHVRKTRGSRSYRSTTRQPCSQPACRGTHRCQSRAWQW